MHEFELINRFFAARKVRRPDVVTGIGDDAAVINTGNHALHTRLAIVTGDHYPEHPHSLSEDILNKLVALIENFEEIGIEPRWLTLALTLPDGKPALPQEISTTLEGILLSHNIELIGGDTTHGPFTLVMQLMGTDDMGTDDMGTDDTGTDNHS